MIGDIDQSVERAVGIIIKSGFDDIFCPPVFCKNFEHLYLEDQETSDLIKKSAKIFLSNSKIEEIDLPKKFSIPKNPYAYRNASLIEVESAVKYLSLVLLAAKYIEESRVPRQRDTVISYRFNQTGGLFSPIYNYNYFRAESARRSSLRNCSVKFATDISNFYDRLNLHRLESALASANVPSKIVKKINDLLMHWAGRNSYGLPVGCDASRILAECALIPVDKALLSSGVNFIRYVDDYRVFAKTFAEAHSHLHLLIELLDREGLFLNTSKTVFFDLSQKDDELIEAANFNEFHSINEEEKKETFKVVKVGYVSKIIKQYRSPGAEKIARISKLDIDVAAKAVGNAPFEKAEGHIKLFIQVYIYQGGKRTDLLLNVIDKYVHSLSYVVDAILKEKKRLGQTQFEKICKKFERYHEKNPKLSPYYRLVILRLLSNEYPGRLGFLLRYFGDLKITESDVFVREFCLRLKDVHDRGLLNAMRNVYDKKSTVIRRAIYYVYTTSPAILEGEKRAWVKSIRASEQDRYIVRQAGAYLGKKAGRI